MQVNQQDDFITHAVIGNQESIAMGVSDGAALMHILSSTLYTYPQLAVARETLCNAWDAHIAAGKTNTPIEITITESQVTIRDYGFGIAHHDIGPIYGVYGNSTKRDDDTVTGGFGLGSKAPFAYTDNFEVISHHLGLKTIYRVSKSSMEKGGKPSINKIVALPTLETGISVSFGLLSVGDMSKFIRLIQEVVVLGEINAQLNGQPVELLLPMSQSPTGYLISDYRGTVTKTVNLRYGNVVYPIPSHEDYLVEYERICSDMGQLWSSASIIFMAKPDTISIAPSREALILTDGTVVAIKELLQAYSPLSMKEAEKVVGQLTRASINKQIKQTSDSVLLELIEDNNTLTANREFSLNSGRVFTTGRHAAITVKMERGHTLNSETQQIKKLEELAKRECVPKHVIRKLVRIHKRNGNRYPRQAAMRAEVARVVTYPLVKSMKMYPILSSCRTRMYFNPGYLRAGFIYPTIKSAYDSNPSIQFFIQRNALIARTLKEAEEYLEQTCKGKRRQVYLILVGTGKEAADRTAAAKAMMTNLGYEVDMHLPEIVKRVRAVPADGTSVVPIKRRKAGTYYSLNHSFDPTYRNFLLSHARTTFTDDTLIDEPIAWVILRPKNNSSDRIGDLSSKASRLVMEKWGNKVAVVTQAQASKLRKQGVMSVSKFLQVYADDVMSASPDFKRYAAFAYYGRDAYRSTDELIYRMCFHEPLMKKLNLRFSVGKEIGLLLSMCITKYEGFDKYPKCQAVLKQVKRHPKFDEISHKMTHSPVVDFISLTSLSTHLDNYGDDAPGTEAAYEIIQLLLK